MGRRLGRLGLAVALSWFLLLVPLPHVIGPTSFLDLQTGASADQRWSDLSDELLATYGISYDQAASISNGYPDGLWRPYSNVTRAQFTTMAVAAFGIAVIDPAAPSFIDVPRSNAHFESIEGAKAAGVVTSSPSGMFQPDKAITREQAFGIVSRCIALASHIELSSLHTTAEIDQILMQFRDAATVSPTSRAEVAFAVECHVAAGDHNHRLAPLGHLTRIQAAALLIRAQPKTVEATAYCRADGVHDDRANVAAALADCKPSDTLHFPAGTYYVSADVACKAGINMTGDGDGRGAKTSWIKGQVKTAPHMTLTDLKMGREGPEYYGFGRTATYDMTLTRCTLTGGPSGGNLCGVIATDREFHDISFVDCIIEGNSGNTSRNGVAFVNYGQATGRIYNVIFRGCTFEPQGRIAVEVLSRSDGTHTYDYPVQNVSFYNCAFQQQGCSSISYGFHTKHNEMAPSGLGGAGWGLDGYSHVENCTFTDPGMLRPGVFVELAPAVSMTIKNNHFTVTTAAAYCSNFFSITNGSSTLHYSDTHNGTSCEVVTDNLLEGNTFDASLQPGCSLTLRNSGWTFRGNTVITQAGVVIQNTRNAVLQNNTFTCVGADGVTPGSVRANLLIQGCDGVTFSGNTFTDNYSRNVRLMYDTYPTPFPALNIHFNGNTYNSGSGNKDVYVDKGCSADGTDSSHLTHE
jgi:hypothetical protein